MTLTLANNFFRIPFFRRHFILKDLDLLTLDESSRLVDLDGIVESGSVVAAREESMNLYKTAFRRAVERKQVVAMERAVLNYL